MSERRGLYSAISLLVLLLAGWAYWPGHTGPTLLDDRSSVAVIGDLKQSPELAWDFVFGNRSGPLGRPVSMASFVLEKLLLGGGVPTSKKVNIVLHLFNGGLLICLFWLLFRRVAVPGYRWLAVILGAAWLFSPLYVSTVLYVVQRMAMLGTTFMLLALIAYVVWREKLLAGTFSTFTLALMALSIILAVFSKENAILVIPVLLLVEALWFQFEGPEEKKLVWLQRMTLGLITFGTVTVLVYVATSYEGLTAGYKGRHFTLDERLLTQSLIVWDYVAQMYVPDLFGMGLYHDDIAVSTSISEPSSTRYSLLAWAGVLLVCLVMLRWRWGRYLTLGVAWFLVGHSIESTVIPLELYFEHRNYFPGIGLFLMVGVLYALLVKRWPEIGPPLLVYLACYVLWLATLTGSQVQIWSNRPLLMLHHLNGHPNSYRANADMAVKMASLGKFEAAREYSAKAHEVSTGERSGDRDLRDLALACIANNPVEPQQLARLGKDNPGRPFGSADTLHTLVHMLQDDACPEFDRERFADRMAELFLADDASATASKNIYMGLALLENTLRRWPNASAYMELFLRVSSEDVQGLMMQLHFATALDKTAMAEELIESLQALDEDGKLTVGDRQNLSLYLEN